MLGVLSGASGIGKFCCTSSIAEQFACMLEIFLLGRQVQPFSQAHDSTYSTISIGAGQVIGSRRSNEKEA